MLLLESHQQFKNNVMNEHALDRAVQVPAPYGNVFERWEAAEAAVMGRRGAEERTQAFADFVQEDYKRLMRDAIEAGEWSAKRKQELRQLATRGQLLFVKPVDSDVWTLIPADELNRLQGSDYTLFSPTLRTATTDLKEVMQEQSLLHVAKNLRGQAFLVQNGWVDDKGVIHVEVIHPKMPGNIEVTVEQSSLFEPLLYTFVKEGKTLLKMEEGRLGTALQEVETNARQLGFEVKDSLEIGVSSAPDDSAARFGAALAGGAVLGNSLVQAANQEAVDSIAELQGGLSAAERARLLGSIERAKLATPAMRVQADAKFDEQKKLHQAHDKRLDERLSQRDAAYQDYRDDKAEQKAQKTQRVRTRKQQTRRRIAAGAAIGGATVAAGTGLTSFIITLTNIL